MARCYDLLVYFTGRSVTEATLKGVDYLSYNFTGGISAPIVSKRETVRLSFKTKTGDGFIFYTG